MSAVMNEATLRDKLAKLNTTQQVIETTSVWCCLFKHEARRIALVWEEVFAKADQAKRLALVYLANDVLQNSRKKGPEFVTEFFKVLPRALRHMMLKADERTAASLNKVIRVWEERRVFGSGTKSFKQLIEEADVPAGRKSGGGLPPPPVTSPRAGPAPAAAAAAAAANGSPAAIAAAAPAAAAAAGKLPSLDSLVLALQQVHQAALRCTHLSTACAAAAAAAQGGSAEDVAASREGLQGYIGAVQQEVQARLAARAELQALLRSQEEAGARLATKLEQASRQLEALEERRRQLGAAGAAPAAAPAVSPQHTQQAALGAVAGQGSDPLEEYEPEQYPSSGEYIPAPMQQHPPLQAQQPAAAAAAPQPAEAQQPAGAAPAAAPPALPAPQQQPQLPAAQHVQGQLQGQQGQGAPSAAAQLPPVMELARVGGEPAGGWSAASDAAALAAQLTSNEQSAQALLEVLLALPPQDQGGFGAGAQGAAQQAQQGEEAAEDLYDPEDPFGDD